MSFYENNKGRNWSLATKKHSPAQAVKVGAVPTSAIKSRAKSLASLDKIDEDPRTSLLSALSTEVLDNISKDNPVVNKENRFQKYVANFTDIMKRPQRMNVTVVIVEAKDLPDAPEDGSTHGIYCKFSLGNETFRTKTIAKTHHPEWKEIFNLTQFRDSNLSITIWDKGKDKYFMGSCAINLSNLEKERTHDLWQPLDDEFGSLHLLITICDTRNSVSETSHSLQHIRDAEKKYAWYKVSSNVIAVGEARVTVHGARGLPASSLGARPLAVCVLELDNARVQTHAARAQPDPLWNHTYAFDVYDVTSTLDVTIFDELAAHKGDILGKINIPLLRINNGEIRWYALKDKNNKIAKGNCPRILLEMHLVWNPVTASLRLFRPKECKYIKAPAKFDVALVLSNLEFVRNTFNFLLQINELVKDFLEWENRDRCIAGLVLWLAVCYFFQLWMAPLLLLAPFFYHWLRISVINDSTHNNYPKSEYNWEHDEKNDNSKTIKSRIHDLQDMTLTITNGVDYLDSVYEKIKNLASFAVPYLSYLVIIMLVISSFLLYTIPFNYIVMALGIYKFGRKYLNPTRIPNNDVLDFISRVPDDDILKVWKELKVPEPMQAAFQKKSRRSFSR